MKIVLSGSGSTLCLPSTSALIPDCSLSSPRSNGCGMAHLQSSSARSLTRSPTFPPPAAAPITGCSSLQADPSAQNHPRVCSQSRHASSSGGFVSGTSPAPPDGPVSFGRCSAKDMAPRRSLTGPISSTWLTHTCESRLLLRCTSTKEEAVDSKGERSAVGSASHFPLHAMLSEPLAIDAMDEMDAIEMETSTPSPRRHRHRHQLEAGGGLFYSEGDHAAELRYNQHSSSTSNHYQTELDVATKAVQLACQLTDRVQARLLRAEEKARTKNDRSLVTVADYGVQAVITWVLTQAFPNEQFRMIAEEDTDALKGRAGVGILQRVVVAVNECLAEAESVGFPKPPPLATVDVLKAIGKGNSEGGAKGRYWVLDPVDGTLGFVRGDQYAIALALIDDGEVVLGVLGCPNLPMRRRWLDYHHKYYRMATKMFPPRPGTWHKGCVIGATRGGGGPWMEPLVGGEGKFSWANARRMRRLIQVSPIDDPTTATFCEPVEKANTAHSLTAGVASSLGMTNQPLRVYSMVKYATIARGNAEVFMKFANASYREKVWDHAAGTLIVEEAGGKVTDAGGRPLDFSKGRYLEGLDRGIIASCGSELHATILSAVDASWDSSRL